jgi:cobalt/nickel transport system permease protein
LATIESTIFDLSYLDTLANQHTAIHSLDPRAKLVTTLTFIGTVISFPRYEISGLMPFLLYPVVMISLGNLPIGYLLKKVCVALPFAFFIGIFNPLFDRVIMMQLGPLAISGGWLSLLSILLRVLTTVLAALILIATTGFTGMCMALEKIGVPKIFVTQLLFMYRYLFVLIDEAARMVRARALRSFDGKGLGLKVFSSIIGHLLLRTLDRAQRIHLAMLSRGFDGEIRIARSYKIRVREIVFGLGWSSLFIVLRLYNLPVLLGNVLMKLGGS